MPNLACKSYHKKPDEYHITTRQKWIAMMTSMRQWGRRTNQGIVHKNQKCTKIWINFLCVSDELSIAITHKKCKCIPEPIIRWHLYTGFMLYSISYVPHSITFQLWCGVMQIAAPIFSLHKYIIIWHAQPNNEISGCHDNHPLLSQPVYRLSSCKLAHHLVLTCGNVACQENRWVRCCVLMSIAII